jgi:predicted component of type VI protein secretion system
MLQARLKVVGGRHHGKTIALTTKKFLIGREQDCHLRPNSELVSRHHCVFAIDDFSVRIRDLGSTNGTFLNDHRVRGEEVLKSGDRIRVGKLDFELVIGEPVAASQKTGDSHPAMPASPDASISETSPLAASDTSFEIPVPAAPDDTGSSILPTESATPVPGPLSPVGAAPGAGDSTVVWSPSAAPGYAPDPYAPMGMPYPQAPYHPPQAPYQPPMYPYMPPGMGYQPPFAYPQMPMSYPGMYPPQMGGYPPPAPAPVYTPPQPAATPEPQDEEAVTIPAVRLPDPKTTGAKNASPPPPAAAPAASAAPPAGDGADGKKEESKPAPPPVKPSEGAADILKKYTQRRPV